MCRAQNSSKSFPEQNAFSNEDGSKKLLPPHGGTPSLNAIALWVYIEGYIELRPPFGNFVR